MLACFYVCICMYMYIVCMYLCKPVYVCVRMCVCVSRGGRIVDVLEWEWESNLGLRLGGEGLLTPINNSLVEHRVYWK